MAVIRGTRKNEELKGTDRADVIYGGGGLSDVVWGLGGDDVIEASGRIYGGDGDDVITGSGSLHGEAGDDRLQAGDAASMLYGGDGNDELRGGAGADYLLAGTGHDRVWGAGGDDWLTIESESGRFDGGAGDDSMRLHLGAVTGKLPKRLDLEQFWITGSLKVGNIEIADMEIINSISMTDNADVLLVGGFAPAGQTSEATWYLTIQMMGGNDRVLGGSAAELVYGGDGDDLLSGSAGDDRLYGDFGTDQLNGGAGKDFIADAYGSNVLRGGMGDDIIRMDASWKPYYKYSGDSIAYGGDGNDTITGGVVNDVLYGDAGDDIIVEKLGNNAIYGGEGNDSIHGGKGVDKINGGAGQDVLSGGAGRDVFVFTAGSIGATVETADLVSDFSRGDTLSLVAIDANAHADGNNRFRFIGTSAFSGRAGQLRYEVVGEETLLLGDTDGDGLADLVIRLSGDTPINTNDLAL